MSRGPLKEVGMEEGGDYAAALRAINRMVDEGRSWSGNERNRCFLNTGQPRFADVSATSGLDFLDDGRAIASVDWDGDGDLDLFQVNRTAPQIRFLRNDWGQSRPWLMLRVVGSECNRDAIGARVELKRQGIRQQDVRTVRAGNSFLSQASKWVHFGLADNTRIQQVVVRWPGGQAESFEGLSANRRYRLVQGSGRAETVPRDRVVIDLASSRPPTRDATEHARIALSGRLPLPPLGYESFEGTSRQLDWRDANKPMLVQLWASWCPMCQEEMKQFKQRADEIRQANVRVLALSVDGIGDDLSTVEQARNAIERRGFPFAAARATESLLEKLELLRGEFFSNLRPFPVPTSFLVDSEGQLAVIYVGPFGVDQLLSDVRDLSVSKQRWRALSFPWKGRWLAPPSPAQLAPLATVFREAGFVDEANWYAAAAAPQLALSHCRHAAELQQRGDLRTALAHYRKALELAPRSATVRNRIGEYLMRRGQLDEARLSFERAAELDPNDAASQYNLGTVHLLMRQTSKAIAGFENAIRIDPDFARAHTALARVLLDQKKIDEGVRHLRLSIAAQADFAPAHVFLGIARLQQNRLDDAAASFREAIRVEPQMIDAHVHLASVLAAQGRLSEAVPHYRTALRMNPKHNQAALKLAWCLATCADESVRSGDEAIRLALQAAEATQYKSPAVLDVLAAAYAEGGRFSEAVDTANKAIQMVEAANPQLAKLFRSRRELYEKRQTYRQ